MKHERAQITFDMRHDRREHKQRASAAHSIAHPKEMAIRRSGGGIGVHVNVDVLGQHSSAAEGIDDLVPKLVQEHPLSLQRGAIAIHAPCLERVCQRQHA